MPTAFAMQLPLQTKTNRHATAPWREGLCIGTWIGYTTVAVIGGANIISMPIFFVCAGIYLVLPGQFLARFFGPQDRPLRPLLSLVYGSALLAGLQCISARYELLWLLRFLPPALSVLELVFFKRISPTRISVHMRATKRSLCTNGGLLWALLCLLYALTMGATNPHPLQAGAVDLSRDLLWNVGNAEALSRGFPAQDIRFSGVRLSYHYMTELLAAGLHRVSGAPLYDIYTFFSGPLFLAAELIALRTLGRRYFGADHPRARKWFIPLLFGFQCASLWKVFSREDGIFNNTMLKHLLTNINSQGTALLFLSAFIVIFISMSRRKFSVDWRYFVALFLSLALFTLSKGPEAAIVVCSFIITMVLVLIFQKPCYRKACLCFVGVVSIFIFLYLLLFASGSSSMTLSIYAMQNYLPYKILSPYTDWLCLHLPIPGYIWLIAIGIINTACMLPLQFVLWVRALPHAVYHLLHLDPARILANGVVVGGFLAYYIFYHASSSQVYFALVAMIFMSLLAAEQLDAIRKTDGLTLCLTRLAGGIAAATTLCMIITYTGQGMARIAGTAGLANLPSAPSDVTAYDEEAMQWLSTHLTPGDIFATNRTSSTPAQIDAISNVYSAFSGCQAYMEGWTYAVSNMGVDTNVVAHKQYINAALFDNTTSATRRYELCKEEGIHCLVYAKKWKGSPPHALIPSYENADVAIYLLE